MQYLELKVLKKRHMISKNKKIERKWYLHGYVIKMCILIIYLYKSNWQNILIVINLIYSNTFIQQHEIVAWNCLPQ